MSDIKRIRYEVPVIFTGDELKKLVERLNSYGDELKACVCQVDLMKRDLLIDVRKPTEDDIFLLGMLVQKTLTDLMNRRYK